MTIGAEHDTPRNIKVDDAPPPRLIGDVALARHAARMRPLRVAYSVVLTVVAVTVAIVVVVAYNRGEISHVRLRTVAAGPPSLALHTPANTLTTAWTSSDAAALGTPYDDGTIVSHDRHTVRGRDARTGAPTWSYTRTDRSICAALQNDGLTIAVYQLHDNCDELTALNSSTGKRMWTRTLDKDGAQFNGPAEFAVQGNTFLFVSSTSIYAIASSGMDSWTFHHPGCTIHSATIGDAGVLISQTCVGENCADQKFCGNGNQLLLRNGITGTDDNSKTNHNNPDQIIWNTLGSDLVPTLAGHHVAARSPTGGALQLLNTNNGKLGARLTLTGRSDGSAPSAAVSASDSDLIWIGGRTYALPADAVSFAWQADTQSVPTVTNPASGVAPLLGTARLTVPTTSGIAQLDAGTGKPERRFAVRPPPAGSLVYPLGSGFLVAGSSIGVYS